MQSVTTSNYVSLAMRTNSDSVGTAPMHPDIIHAALGMGDEILELAAAIQNADVPNIGEELGDLCWFLALSGNDIADKNQLFLRTTVLASPTPYQDLQVAINTYISNVKKNYAYGKPYKASDRLDHIRAIWSGICDTASLYSLDIMSILATNIQKLEKRFPEKFTADAAVNRDLAGERVILENAVSGKSTAQLWLEALPEALRATTKERDGLLVISTNTLKGRRVYDLLRKHNVNDHAYMLEPSSRDVLLRASTTKGQLRDQISAILRTV